MDAQKQHARLLLQKFGATKQTDRVVLGPSEHSSDKEVSRVTQTQGPTRENTSAQKQHAHLLQQKFGVTKETDRVMLGPSEHSSDTEVSGADIFSEMLTDSCRSFAY
jgi:hypothetical protein